MVVASPASSDDRSRMLGYVLNWVSGCCRNATRSVTRARNEKEITTSLLSCSTNWKERTRWRDRASEKKYFTRIETDSSSLPGLLVTLYRVCLPRSVYFTRNRVGRACETRHSFSFRGRILSCFSAPLYTFSSLYVYNILFFLGHSTFFFPSLTQAVHLKLENNHVGTQHAERDV